MFRVVEIGQPQFCSFVVGGLVYYVFNLTPNQPPKLLNLSGDDGVIMNEELVSLCYIMLFPLVLIMLLLPTDSCHMCIGFTLLSTFAAFWVYNDMTSRRQYNKGSWLLPLSWVLFLGPALYLFLRPSLSEMLVSIGILSFAAYQPRMAQLTNPGLYLQENERTCFYTLKINEILRRQIEFSPDKNNGCFRNYLQSSH